MKVIKTLSEWKVYRRSLSGSIGFVPTMGALHEGHVNLLTRARVENNIVALSIFVNRTQFNDPKDFEKYPIQLEKDLELAKNAGVDAVFIPVHEEMYPDGYRYRIQENSESKILCGEHRLGHFDGVLTVVLKLFQLVKPTRAYFGQKVFQQLRLIEGMVDAFFLDVGIVACEIVRDENGLALSSRNALLNSEEMRIAIQFAKTLQGHGSVEEIQQSLLTKGLQVDYVSERWGRKLAAVHVGNVRLIDNVDTGNANAGNANVER